MWKKDSTGTAESQVSKRVIIGIDMGGNLWATVIHDCVMRKDRYYGLKDRDKKRKEDRFYDLLREYLGQGYAVDVFYEAGRYGFAPARIMLQLGAKVHILPINKLKVIMCGKVIKTDKLDAKFLSGLDPEAGLPEVYIPTVEQESRRDAERELVRLSKEADSWDQLIQLQEKKDEMNSKKPDNRDKTHETVRKLKQFKSIGPDIARCLAWEVADWERFGNAKKFSSFFGMTPCPFSSGTINREQGISKAGRKSLRKKAIEQRTRFFLG